MEAFTSRYIFDGNVLHEYSAVIVDKHLITDLVPLSDIPFDMKITNLGDGVIAPGFIDLQLNGCGGVLFNNDISQNTLEVMYQTWLKFGTTGFLPTLITSGEFGNIIAALEVVKDWFSKFGNCRGVLGIHLEGPFISKVRHGIHNEEFIIPPTIALLERIVCYRQFFPIKMTIAVENFTKEQIKFLIDNKIILSIGHSDANYTQAEEVIKLGASTATHVFNAMSGLSGRNPGVIGAILNNDVYAGVIADMFHVDRANIRLLDKFKRGWIYLVSDAVTPAGTHLDQFDLLGKTLYLKDGRCIDKDGVLGGAYLTMSGAVKNCVDQCGLGLATALAMASLIPAKVMELDNILGKIKNGYRADLIYLGLNDFIPQIIESNV